MNRTMLLALLAVSSVFAASTYTIDVARSGIASVTLSLDSGDAVEVGLPADAYDFRIVGGSYSISGGNATVTAGPSGLAVFSFTSSALTAKTDSGWKLSFSPPEGAEVRIYAPPYAVLGEVFPRPESVASDGSRLVIETPYSRQITAYYKLEEQPQAPEQQEILLPLAIIASALVLAAAFLHGRKSQAAMPAPLVRPAAAERPPGLEMSAGKREMMETFNANDLKIVNRLLECGGKSRRNELERRSEISKSSLAMALNRLEKRKIIEMDRTATTHFVRLSDYFLRL